MNIISYKIPIKQELYLPPPPSFQGCKPLCRMSDITKEQMLEVLNKGLSVKQICEKLNIAESSYYKLVRKFDIHTPRKKALAHNASVTKEDILKLQKEGKSCNEILDILKITFDAYTLMLSRFKIVTDLMISKKTISNITKERLEELIQSGKKVSEICKELNIPERTYTRLLGKFEIETERQKAKKHIASITQEMIQKLVDNKLSKAEICEILKINNAMFYRLLKKFGINYDYLHHNREIVIPENRLRAAVELGKTSRETASDLGVTVNVYHAKAKNAHVDTVFRKSIDKIASISKEEIQSSIDSGMTIKQICEKYSITPSNYKALREKYNLSTPQRKSSLRISKITPEQLIEMRNSGKSPKEICKELSISQNAYYKIMKNDSDKQ